MDWFLYDNGLHHERVNKPFISLTELNKEHPLKHPSKKIPV